MARYDPESVLLGFVVGFTAGAAVMFALAWFTLRWAMAR